MESKRKNKPKNNELVDNREQIGGHWSEGVGGG